MQNIMKKIKIIPLNKVLIHENVVSKWAENIATYIQESGIQKNPIVVHKANNNYIVLDGMHRVQAFKILQCKDIMVYEVDYFSKDIILKGWDAVVFTNENTLDLLKLAFSKEYIINKVSFKTNFRFLIDSKKILFGVKDKKGNAYTISLKQDLYKLSQKNYIDIIVNSIEKFESILDIKKLKLLYLPDTNSDNDFKTLASNILLYRPIFKKDDIVYRTLSGKIFPRKSTRHIIPGRPLRVDINLTILKENIGLRIKNKLLKSHLMWCFENNKVRFYPEPIYIFAD